MDIRVQAEGHVYVLYPETETGHCWLRDHVDTSRPRWCGGVVCEWRYVDPIVSHAIEDGLIVGS